VNIEHIMPASGKNIATIRHDAGFIDADKDKEIADFNRQFGASGGAVSWDTLQDFGSSPPV